MQALGTITERELDVLEKIADCRVLDTRQIERVGEHAAGQCGAQDKAETENDVPGGHRHGHSHLVRSDRGNVPRDSPK